MGPTTNNKRKRQNKICAKFGYSINKSTGLHKLFVELLTYVDVHALSFISAELNNIVPYYYTKRILEI